MGHDPPANWQELSQRFSWEEIDGVADSSARRGESEVRANGIVG